jgi:hypothetical protein
MPTHEECNERRVEAVKLMTRTDAISERLDELLEEVRGLKKWFSTYGTVAFFVAVLGDKALPIIGKILGNAQ